MLRTNAILLSTNAMQFLRVLVSQTKQRDPMFFSLLRTSVSVGRWSLECLDGLDVAFQFQVAITALIASLARGCSPEGTLDESRHKSSPAKGSPLLQQDWTMSHKAEFDSAFSLYNNIFYFSSLTLGLLSASLLGCRVGMTFIFIMTRSCW
jgi:hypothetical protein